jgi:hypothetical protein
VRIAVRSTIGAAHFGQWGAAAVNISGLDAAARVLVLELSMPSSLSLRATHSASRRPAPP